MKALPVPGSTNQTRQWNDYKEEEQQQQKNDPKAIEMKGWDAYGIICYERMFGQQRKNMDMKKKLRWKDDDDDDRLEITTPICIMYKSKCSLFHSVVVGY